MDIAKYIKPLSMNGLNGRMLRLPAKNPKKSTEILLLPGHHNSIERMEKFAEIFSEYGIVTIPDLPGFGGMDSFYKIGETPTIENYADYLAAYIKLRYKSKKLVIVGFSFSVPIFVKMLQKYPELQKKVLACVSLSGFVHHEDFRFKKLEVLLIKSVSWIVSRRPVAYVLSKVFFKKTIIKHFLSVDYVNLKNRRLESKEERNLRIDIDTQLWIINDLATAFYTYIEMFKVDLCNEKIDLPIYNLSCEGDYYFNKSVVDQHMQIIFSKYTELPGKQGLHVPPPESSIEKVREYLPAKVLKTIKVFS